MRLHGGHVQRLQRRGRDRPDAQREHRTAQQPQQLVAETALVGPPEQARRRGRAGEREHVHPAREHGVGQPVHRPDVGGRLPPVDRHLDDLGARPSSAPRRSRAAVRRAAAPRSACPRRPSSSRCSSTSADDSDSGDHASRQARRADRAARLRAAGDQRARAQGVEQVRPEPQPSAASTQPRNPIPVVATVMSGGWAIERLRRREQVGVVGERDDADRRPVQDHRAPALEHGAELLRATGRRHPDREARQRGDGRGRGARGGSGHHGIRHTRPFRSVPTSSPAGEVPAARPRQPNGPGRGAAATTMVVAAGDRAGRRCFRGCHACPWSDRAAGGARRPVRGCETSTGAGRR